MTATSATATAAPAVRDAGADAGAPVLTRVSFRFSPAGTRAVCLAAADGPAGGDASAAALYLEGWSFEGESAAPRWEALPVPGGRPVGLEVQPLPLDDGRVLLCRNGAGAHEVTLLSGGTGSGGPPCERSLGMLRATGLRLLPAPGADPRCLCYAIAFEAANGEDSDDRNGDGGRSTIWRVRSEPPWLERLATVPGLLQGGVWLDQDATLLGADLLARAGGPVKAVAIDLRDGSHSTLLDVAPGSNDRLLLCAPRSGLLLVATDASGEERVGWTVLGRSQLQPVRFPPGLCQPGEPLRPLTLDPDGRRVLLQLDQGVRSWLAVYTPASDQLDALDIPDGRVRGTAHWGTTAIRFPFSAPTVPPAVLTVADRPGAGADAAAPPAVPAWSLSGAAATATAAWAAAHVEQLDGAAGPIEAIVYGGPGWRASRRLLLALHGGPAAAWRFDFDPLFQALAAAGIAVVAPNQRGSSGYGRQHRLALRGAWGGPDLEDIRSIAAALVRERRVLGLGGGAERLGVLGESYGAFLALLAACTEPALWSGCVALAPFLSGQRLLRGGTASVRSLVTQLGGDQELHDHIGPRDLLRLCGALRCPLLIVHGDRDPVIPVAESRALRHRLLELGRREGEGGDFEYLEVGGGGHDLTGAAGGEALRRQVVRFLLGLPTCPDETPRGGENA